MISLAIDSFDGVGINIGFQIFMESIKQFALKQKDIRAGQYSNVSSLESQESWLNTLKYFPAQFGHVLLRKRCPFSIIDISWY